MRLHGEINTGRQVKLVPKYKQNRESSSRGRTCNTLPVLEGRTCLKCQKIGWNRNHAKTNLFTKKQTEGKTSDWE
uniref:Uncharacterized protein n=1 Tax=Anguilla anguilla TaxID=7936 RepID=A0A0E9XEH7_ANGAN